MNLYLTWNLLDQKALLKREIYKAGESLEMHRKLKVTLESIEKDKSKSVSIAKRLVLEEYFGKTEKL